MLLPSMCCARVKETSKQVQHEAVVNAGKVVGSYRSNSNDKASEGRNVQRVVFATSVSLVEPGTDTEFMSRMAAVAAVEPDADGLDLLANEYSPRPRGSCGAPTARARAPAGR